MHQNNSSDNTPAISVLIATRNRAACLRGTLESLMLPGNLGESDWEIVVANNGSTDDTTAVCAEFEMRYPEHFRFVIEPAPGKSNALNAAIKASKGGILAFIDDDVICDADYLPGVRSFSRNFNQIAQGRTFVDYLGDRPKWFDSHFDEMMGTIDMGDQTCDLPRGFWGLNVIIHRGALKRVGGFCPVLGPGAVGFQEDGEYTLRLRTAGYRLFYTPQFVVRHQVSAQRLTLWYLLSRSYKLGISTAYYEAVSGRGLFSYSLYSARQMILAPLVACWLFLTGKRAPAAHLLCDTVERTGFVIQKWRFRFNGRPHLTAPAF